MRLILPLLLTVFKITALPLQSTSFKNVQTKTPYNLDQSYNSTLNQVSTQATPLHRYNIDHETLKLLVPLSRYAQISYCLGTIEGIYAPFRCRYGCTQFPQTELLYQWTDDFTLFSSPVAGYLAADHQRKLLILMFRPSHSISEFLNGWRYSLTDYVPFDVDPEFWNNPSENPYFCDPTIIDNTNTARRVHQGCKVHRGLYRQYQLTMPALSETVELLANDPVFNGYRFVIAGHSTGGLMAAMVGTDFLIKGINNTVVTFGSARFGNEAFANWFDKTRNLIDSPYDSSRTYFRVTKPHDPYVRFPPSPFYHDTSGEVYISDVDSYEPREQETYFCPGQRNTYCSASTETDLANWLFSESIHMHYFTDFHGCAIEHSYVPLKDIPPSDPENPY